MHTDCLLFSLKFNWINIWVHSAKECFQSGNEKISRLSRHDSLQFADAFSNRGRLSFIAKCLSIFVSHCSSCARSCGPAIDCVKSFVNSKHSSHSFPPLSRDLWLIQVLDQDFRSSLLLNDLS